MPKEDAQLICPISYDDPHDLWITLGAQLAVHLPLKDLVVKSPMTNHNVTIHSLPLRFMPASASLFKDTNHPFRWFLAPYVCMYVLHAPDMASYRSSRSILKTWIESRGKSDVWVIVYATPANATVNENNEYSRVYDKLSSEFYFHQHNDRTVQVQHQPISTSPRGPSLADSRTALLFLKIWPAGLPGNCSIGCSYI